MAPKDFSSLGEILAVIVMIRLSQATAYWQVVVLFVAVVSVGKTAGLGQTLVATVNQLFIRRKAVTMSTVMTALRRWWSNRGASVGLGYY